MDERLLDVNHHGVLRVPGVMLLAFVLLARHWIWTFFLLLVTRSGGVVMAEILPLMAQSPVVLLILMAGRRLPEAGSFVRGTWRMGHVLVWFTVILNVAWMVWSLAGAEQWHRPELMMACFSLLDVAIGWHFWKSPHARQVFAEFPASLSSSAAKK